MSIQNKNMEIMDYDEDYIVIETKTISYLLLSIIIAFFCFIFYLIFIIIADNYILKKNE